MTKKLLLVSLFVVSIISYSSAQKPTKEMGQMQGKPDPSKLIEMLDTDKDGKISKLEAKNAKKGKLYERFSHIDSNNDSYITKEELESAFKNRPNK